MSNGIKGITVEIGADTTKLGKALEDVNKRGRELSSELGQINKLLKLDPGNTELLSQKQKVLAEAVETTSKKLDTLKNAEKQVQEQFERGEVSEEQVRALQREIITATKKLESYEKAAKETADAIDNLGDSSDQFEKENKDVKKSADNASDSLDDLANSAEKAEKSSDGLGSKLKDLVTNGLTAVATAATAVVGALVSSAEESRDYRKAMGQLDTAFTANGHSSENAKKTYKELQGILGETDQAVEAANHLAKLTTNEKDLATWTNIATGVYATFGASLPIENLTEAANETAKTGALTGGLADALNWAGENEEEFQAKLDDCNTEQERQALITETLTGLYSEAADKYRETSAEIIRANEANELLSNSMAEIGGVVESVLTDVKLMGATLLSEFVPSIKEATSAFKSLLNGDEGGAEQFGVSISNILTQLLTKLAGLAPALVDVALSVLSTLIVSVVSMLPQFADTGLQIILSLISGISEAAPIIFESISSMIPLLVSSLQSNLPLIISGIVSLAVSIAESIGLILPPLISALPGLIMSICQALTSNAPILLSGIILLLSTITQNIGPLVQAILPLIPLIITEVCTAISECLPMLLSAIMSLSISLTTQILPLIIIEITKAIPQILVAIISGLGQILVSVGSWFGNLFTNIGQWLSKIGAKISEWLSQLPGKAQEGANNFVNGFINFVKNLPEKVGYFLGMVIGKIASWVVNTASQAKEAGTNFVNNVVKFFENLPSNIWTWLQNTISKVTIWGTNLITAGKKAAKDLVTNVVNGLKNLPTKLTTIGKDLVKGLWNGIKNMTSWVKNKIKGFSENVLQGIKDFFEIKSPSRIMRDEVGKMIARGLAIGIDENKNEVQKATEAMSEELLASEKKYAEESLRIQREKDEKALAEKLANAKNRKERSAILAEEQQKKDEESQTKYLESLKKTAEEERKLFEARKKDLENAKTNIQNTFKQLTEECFDELEKLEDLQNSFADKLISAHSVVNKVNSGGVEYSYLTDLNSQITDLATYNAILMALKNRTEKLPENFFETIRDMSYEDGKTYAGMLLRLTDEEFSKYLEDWQRKQDLAAEISKVMYADEVEDLKTSIESKFADANEEFLKIGKDAGVEFETGFLAQLKNTVTQVVATISQAIGNLSVDVGGTISLGVGNLTKFARGGIVRSATNALIGEDGAEAIIPLERHDEWISNVAHKLNDRTNPGASATNTALLDKLDGIYERLGRLQMVVDSGALVGEILDDIDAGLADKQLLNARGV